jgi:hypothetical protein
VTIHPAIPSAILAETQSAKCAGWICFRNPEANDEKLVAFRQRGRFNSRLASFQYAFQPAAALLG